MSFISNLFKKKPGGTFIGNLFRTVTGVATGGLINLPPPAGVEWDTDGNGKFSAEELAFYKANKNNPAALQQRMAELAAANLPVPQLDANGNVIGTKTTAASFLKKYPWVKWLGIAVGLFGLVFLVIKVVKKSSKKRRY